jgi:hypothetical protein
MAKLVTRWFRFLEFYGLNPGIGMKEFFCILSFLPLDIEKNFYIIINTHLKAMIDSYKPFFQVEQLQVLASESTENNPAQKCHLKKTSSYSKSCN